MDLLQQAWTHSMDYSGYRKLIEQLVQEGKTTGPVQDEHLINYSKLNIYLLASQCSIGCGFHEIASALQSLFVFLTVAGRGLLS